jgi:hypothetical protein
MYVFTVYNELRLASEAATVMYSLAGYKGNSVISRWMADISLRLSAIHIHCDSD